MWELRPLTLGSSMSTKNGAAERIYLSHTAQRGQFVVCARAKGRSGQTGWQGPGGIPSCDWQAAEQLSFAPTPDLDLVQGQS